MEMPGLERADFGRKKPSKLETSVSLSLSAPQRGGAFIKKARRCLPKCSYRSGPFFIITKSDSLEIQMQVN